MTAPCWVMNAEMGEWVAERGANGAAVLQLIMQQVPHQLMLV